MKVWFNFGFNGILKKNGRSFESILVYLGTRKLWSSLCVLFVQSIGYFCGVSYEYLLRTHGAVCHRQVELGDFVVSRNVILNFLGISVTISQWCKFQNFCAP